VSSHCSEIASRSLGIALFTHHKYRKRLESDVPLDPHGQPLDPEDDEGPGPGSIALRDGYGIPSVGHVDGGTTAVRPQCRPARPQKMDL